MPKINILHDGSFDIAIGKHRRDTSWKNKQMTWVEFVRKVSETHRTAESYMEYLAAKKPRQDEIKDVGGYVGGYLTGGRRKNGSVVHRQLITLDVDFAAVTLWDDFTFLYDCAAVLYSTHKHSPKTPRYRLIIPLDREVMTDEYTAISRRIAGQLGIELFDHTTFQPTRLMYWPSTSKDGEYIFEWQDGPWLNADEILETYYDWRDSSEWPVSSKESIEFKLKHKEQEDPLTKRNVVGAFCRTYGIHEAIETFLSDIYEPCDMPGRYTYKEGSTSAGLITYDDKFAYSHHGTDPISGHLCNAWDLVRIHLFAHKDQDVKEKTPAHNFPSFRAMQELALNDTETKRTLAFEKLQGIKTDFDEEPTEEEEAAIEWMSEMEMDGRSNFLSSRKNFQLVLCNEPALKDKFAYDLFSKRKVITGDLPWRRYTEDTKLLTDEDECELRIHLADRPYRLSHNSNLKDVFDAIIVKNTVHPVKDYLSGLLWDGESRLDTVFIDYMGAADSEYTRAITRKALAACVARIYEPGIKFDHVLTLVGDEGKQKSSILRKLAREWFSDTFSFKMLERGKEAFEQLQGYWIIEIAELTGIRKADNEAIKHFITKADDVYRIPHKQYTSQFKRQCVFFGTTNKWDFLQGADGNRRFWPMPILVQVPGKNINKDLTDDEVDHIWAEAVHAYKKGEKLYLSTEIEESAKEMQRGHTEKDDRAGAVEKYLEILLPKDWDDMPLSERQSFIQGDELAPKGTEKRNTVCVAEIWCELFGRHVSDMNSFNTKGLHGIMQTMPGWKKSTLRRFKNYGAQIAYVRTETGLSVNADGNITVNAKK